MLHKVVRADTQFRLVAIGEARPAGLFVSEAIVPSIGWRTTRVSLLPGNRSGPLPAGRPAAMNIGELQPPRSRPNPWRAVRRQRAESDPLPTESQPPLCALAPGLQNRDIHI
jgi:hypothetical protein